MSENKELNMNELEQVAGGDNKPKKWVVYETIDGDTLGRIAGVYFVSVGDLKHWNPGVPDIPKPRTPLRIFTINY